MKIVLATPLYPPDIEQPAPYVKEAARRLSAQHDITIVTYGHLPETVPGVLIHAIDKRRPLLLRLIAYTAALWSATRGADVLYAENGASVELPAALVSLVSGTPLFLHLGDAAAHTRARGVRRSIERLAIRRARVVSDMPESRPELLPFDPPPEAALRAYETSWEKHLGMLNRIFTHDR